MANTNSNLAYEQAEALKRGPPVGVAMSEDANDASKDGLLQSILNPGPVLSPWFFGLGSWILLLGILNVLVMAHPTGKISWVGFLSLGEVGQILMTDSTQQGFHLVGDSIFLGFGLVLIGLGAKGINNNVEGGLSQWLKGLVINDLWPALMSSEESGWRKTFSAWLLVLGFVFYIYWGIMYTGWVDPGVYAVAAALIGFGFALLAMPAQDGESAPMD